MKDLSTYFYACEEQQRIRAMELIEYARINGITLNEDYNQSIQKSPIDKSLAVKDFIQELFVQEQQDIKSLEKASTCTSDNDLIQFLESKRRNQINKQQEIVQFLAVALPTLDISRIDILDPTAATTSDIASRWNLNNLPKSGHIVNTSPLDHHKMDPSSLVTATGATTGAIGVATVDPESLPSTEEIFDALPIAVDFDFDLATSNFATFLEEQSDLMDTIQQNLVDTETLSQIVDAVAQLY